MNNKARMTKQDKKAAKQRRDSRKNRRSVWQEAA